VFTLEKVFLSISLAREFGANATSSNPKQEATLFSWQFSFSYPPFRFAPSLTIGGAIAFKGYVQRPLINIRLYVYAGAEFLRGKFSLELFQEAIDFRHAEDVLSERPAPVVIPGQR